MHLAQLNIGRAKYPIDDERMYGFTSRLDEINALADTHEGFVWRLQSETGNATEVRPFEDSQILVNLSVWTSIAALHEYVYKTAHAALMRDRKQWFERMGEVYTVLWWIPEGQIPNVEEAKARLTHLKEHGSTPFAFTFQQSFPPPSR